ncbi:hypothetical protein CC85DRAFT_196166 [Cutaneotrichosporon oleaginosum]|uniref:Uncharacterized protein n=1 Tax=Cutaneotrichosporon oleaginosum TaxID=879819 RepID=A0A0J1AVZ6_9TREE|nr:uncharacterized protein CC85DRAFT_196166 [Cutaneotrichosporon oleaginosum]KLT39439.1 hypothetical protein CC85DRAFT_196166 [Cutaneotrichosporon oleaginosum]TXT08445.1 hypothetical protein COLE_05369 [Cutaneotrichosporon oleaginosum]
MPADRAVPPARAILLHALPWSGGRGDDQYCAECPGCITNLQQLQATYGILYQRGRSPSSWPARLPRQLHAYPQDLRLLDRIALSSHRTVNAPGRSPREPAGVLLIRQPSAVPLGQPLEAQRVNVCTRSMYSMSVKSPLHSVAVFHGFTRYIRNSGPGPGRPLHQCRFYMLVFDREVFEFLHAAQCSLNSLCDT